MSWSDTRLGNRFLPPSICIINYQDPLLTAQNLYKIFLLKHFSSANAKFLIYKIINENIKQMHQSNESKTFCRELHSEFWELQIEYSKFYLTSLCETLPSF